MPNKNSWNIRKEYKLSELKEENVLKCPFEQFEIWFNEAKSTPILEPNAMALATSDKNNQPSVRFVLLKGFDKTGLYFYSNYESKKAKQIEENPQASIAIYWDALERQIRVEGKIEKTSEEQSNDYFSSRPRDSQISALSSKQSQVINSKVELKKHHNEISKLYENKQIIRPKNWGGYILIPSQFEFWQGRPDRLHDRLQYKPSKTDKETWKITRLSP